MLQRFVKSFMKMVKHKSDLWLGIDPGSVRSGYVVFDKDEWEIVDCDIVGNYYLQQMVLEQYANKCKLVIEKISSYGMRVGNTVFDTIYWTGRFAEKWYSLTYEEPYFLTRKEVVRILCMSVKANDADVRQAIIDMFPPTGEGKIPQIGTKKKKGPLYGLKKDMWQALALILAKLEEEYGIKRVYSKSQS